MTNARLFCLPAGLLILGMAGLSAQVPKVGTAPVVKSGDPSKPAQIKPADPVKAPNPVPLPKVGPPSVVPPGGVNPPGVPPVMPKDVVPPLGPGKKEEDQYPKEIEEKTLNMWMNELRTSKDAQVREAAVRVVPLFGPRAIALKATSELLLATLKTDPDLNVRLAALSVAPYMSYNQQEDPLCNDRIDIVTRMLSSESLPVRYDATIAMAGIGPVAKKAIPQLVARTNEPASWLTRKAAASALGSVGRGWVNPDNPADKVDPAELAVTALLNQVKADPSAAVRREAANSLILVGPVSAVQMKVWKISLETVLKNEKDRATQNLLRGRPQERPSRDQGERAAAGGHHRAAFGERLHGAERGVSGARDARGRRQQEGPGTVGRDYEPEGRQQRDDGGHRRRHRHDQPEGDDSPGVEESGRDAQE